MNKIDKAVSSSYSSVGEDKTDKGEKEVKEGL